MRLTKVLQCFVSGSYLIILTTILTVKWYAPIKISNAKIQNNFSTMLCNNKIHHHQPPPPPPKKTQQQQKKRKKEKNPPPPKKQTKTTIDSTMVCNNKNIKCELQQQI